MLHNNMIIQASYIKNPYSYIANYNKNTEQSKVQQTTNEQSNYNTYNNPSYRNIILSYLDNSKSIETTNQNYIVFSDIHGDLLNLICSLKRAGVKFDETELTEKTIKVNGEEIKILYPKIIGIEKNVICLGDLIDKGPESLECLSLMIDLKNQYPDKVTLMVGNHELAYNNQTYKDAKVNSSEKYTGEASYNIVKQNYQLFTPSYVLQDKHFSHAIVNKRFVLSNLFLLKEMDFTNDKEYSEKEIQELLNNQDFFNNCQDNNTLFSILNYYIKKLGINNINDLNSLKESFKIRGLVKSQCITESKYNELKNKLSEEDYLLLNNVIGKILLNLKFNDTFKEYFTNHDQYLQEYIENNILAISTKDDLQNLSQEPFKKYISIHGHDDIDATIFNEKYNSLNIDSKRSIGNNCKNHKIRIIEIDKNGNIQEYNLDIENNTIEKNFTTDKPPRGIVNFAYKNQNITSLDIKIGEEKIFTLQDIKDGKNKPPKSKIAIQQDNQQLKEETKTLKNIKTELDNNMATTTELTIIK